VKLQVIVVAISVGVVAPTMFGSMTVAAAQPAPTAIPTDVNTTAERGMSLETKWSAPAPSVVYLGRIGATNESCRIESAVRLNTSEQFSEAISECAPATASTPPTGVEQMTAKRFEALVPGNESVARYPPHATRITTPLVTDAHLTVFGIHPTTRIESGGNTTPLHIAPRGTIRALVDYRLTRAGLNDSSPTVTAHGVSAVRLRVADSVVAEQSATNQTPQIDYVGLPTGPVRLVVEADIRLVHNSTGGENSTGKRVTVVTVRDTLRVVVSDVTSTTVDVAQATYPTGETAVTVRHPYARRVEITVNATNGTSLFDSSTATSTLAEAQPVTQTHVWSRWRFRVEENASWTQLIAATATETTQTTAAAPVFVHALRTRSGASDEIEVRRSSHRITTPQRGPDGVTPIRLTTVDAASLNRAQTTVRVPLSQQPTQVVVSGLVRGEHRRIDLHDHPMNRIRQPVVSTTLRNQRMTTATIVIALRDPETGEPIVVTDEATAETISASNQASLTVDGESVTTDSDGRAVVSIDEYGPHQIVYQPGRLRVNQSEPSYSATAKTVTWHPLATVSGWLRFLAELLAWGLCGLGILYGGRHIGRLVQRGDER
jgi:hypothetical protein